MLHFWYNNKIVKVGVFMMVNILSVYGKTENKLGIFVNDASGKYLTAVQVNYRFAKIKTQTCAFYIVAS